MAKNILDTFIEKAQQDILKDLFRGVRKSAYSELDNGTVLLAHSSGYYAYAIPKCELYLDINKLYPADNLKDILKNNNDKRLIPTSAIYTKGKHTYIELGNAHTKVYIEEKYYKMFKDFLFYGNSPTQRVLVYFGDYLLGVVMPCRFTPTTNLESVDK